MSDQLQQKSFLTDKDDNRLYQARHLALFISNLAFASCDKDKTYIEISPEALGETMKLIAYLTTINAVEV